MFHILFFSPNIGAPSSNTLPRNAFSTLEQEKLVEMLQGRGNNTTNSNILTSQKSMGERSKTLGPGFMRGHHHNTVVFLNYHNAAYTNTYLKSFFFSYFFFIFRLSGYI